MSELLAAGICPLSTIDMPGRSATVIFLSGCPLNCPYCHNPDFRDPAFQGLHIDIEETLELYKPYIAGVVISGGEPLQSLEACKRILSAAHELDLVVGLETSGALPSRLSAMIRAGVDEVYLDVKSDIANPEAYNRAVGVPPWKGDISQSVRTSLILCMSHQVRTWLRTVVFPEIPAPRRRAVENLIKLYGGGVEDWTWREGSITKRMNAPPVGGVRG